MNMDMIRCTHGGARCCSLDGIWQGIYTNAAGSRRTSVALPDARPLLM